MPREIPPIPPLIPHYSAPTPPPARPLLRFLVIIPLTILGFFLFFAALVVTILPGVPLLPRIGGAAILGAGVAYFVYWLIRSYRKKYAGTRPMTAREKILYALLILAVVALRVLVEYLPQLLGR